MNPSRNSWIAKILTGFPEIIFSLILVLSMDCRNVVAQNFWEQLPGPPGGIIGHIESDTSGQILVADARITISPDYSIVFYSSDGGQTWSRSGFQFEDRITDFVYANDGSFVAGGNSKGVFRSTDNGMNWEYESLFNQYIWSLGKDDLGNIYAGSDLVAKIYKSTNHGQNWELIFIPSESGSRVGILHLSNQTGTLFAGLSRTILRSSNHGIDWEPADSGISTLGRFNCITSDSNGNIFATSSHSGEFFWSTDDGNYWVDTDTNDVLRNLGKTDLIETEGLLFCSAWDGVLVSMDKGYTWNFTNTGLYYSFGTDLMKGPQNEIYLGTYGSGIFKSIDQGNTWFQTSNGINCALILDITFDKIGNIYAAAWNGGLHKSMDDGLTWQTVHNGLTNLSLQCLLSTKGGDLFAGTDDGLFRSTDNGESWNRTSAVGHDDLYEIYENSLGNLYAIDYGNGLWRSSDSGENWIRVSNSFANQFVFGFAIDSNDNLFAGTRAGQIYKSTDHGQNWMLSRNGLNSNNTVMTISASPDSILYAGTIEDGVFRSTNNGQYWEGINNGIDDTNIRYLNARKENELFASIFYGGLYFSSDSGNSWVDISHGLERTGSMSFCVGNAIAS